jgi:hypothetical protein
VEEKKGKKGWCEMFTLFLSAIGLVLALFVHAVREERARLAAGGLAVLYAGERPVVNFTH